MNYKWLTNVAKISDDYTFIKFYDSFNQKIEPNTLPKNVLTLIFGMFFNQIIKLNTLPKNITTLIFGWHFNQKILLNTLPENLTTLTFGENFNQKIEPASLPKNLTTLTFGKCFNRKIKQDSLPENLTTLTFGWYFNQNVENILSNIKHISFNWLTENYFYTKKDFDVINNIPIYFNVKIYADNNIFQKCNPKWSIHVINYTETDWPSDIYEIIGKHVDPKYGDIVVLINKESYELYSHAKSALK